MTGSATYVVKEHGGGFLGVDQYSRGAAIVEDNNQTLDSLSMRRTEDECALRVAKSLIIWSSLHVYLRRD